MSALRFSVAAVTIAVIMATQGTLGSIAQVPATAFDRLLAIVLISGTTPILLYYKGLATTRASTSTIVELVFPFSAVVLNWIFLNDKLVWQQIVAGLVLLYAIVQVQRFNRQAAPQPQRELAPVPTPSAE
jgi:drug/metabolite transporter (DMT)-like permease